MCVSSMTRFSCFIWHNLFCSTFENDMFRYTKCGFYHVQRTLVLSTNQPKTQQNVWKWQPPSTWRSLSLTPKCQTPWFVKTHFPGNTQNSLSRFNKVSCLQTVNTRFFYQEIKFTAKGGGGIFFSNSVNIASDPTTNCNYWQNLRTSKWR